MSDENEWELYELEATISKLKAELATARDEVEELTEQNRLACLCAVKTGLFDVANRDYPDQMDIAKALVDARADTKRLEWLFHYVSAKEFRRIGVIYGDGSLKREAIDKAMEGSR